MHSENYRLSAGFAEEVIFVHHAVVGRRLWSDAKTMLVERDFLYVCPQVELVGNKQAIAVLLCHQQSIHANTKPHWTCRVL